MLDLEKKYSLNEDIVIRGIGDKYWALNTKTGNQYRLNSTSYTILNAFRESRNTQEIVTLILNEYNVEKERVYNDCNVVIPYAIEKQLIKEVIS